MFAVVTVCALYISQVYSLDQVEWSCRKNCVLWCLAINRPRVHQISTHRQAYREQQTHDKYIESNTLAYGVVCYPLRRWLHLPTSDLMRSKTSSYLPDGIASSSDEDELCFDMDMDDLATPLMTPVHIQCERSGIFTAAVCSNDDCDTKHVGGDVSTTISIGSYVWTVTAATVFVISWPSGLPI